jgi:TPR repeat protein
MNSSRVRSADRAVGAKSGPFSESFRTSSSSSSTSRPLSPDLTPSDTVMNECSAEIAVLPAYKRNALASAMEILRRNDFSYEYLPIHFNDPIWNEFRAEPFNMNLAQLCALKNHAATVIHPHLPTAQAHVAQSHATECNELKLDAFQRLYNNIQCGCKNDWIMVSRLATFEAPVTVGSPMAKAVVALCFADESIRIVRCNMEKAHTFGAQCLLWVRRHALASCKVCTFILGMFYLKGIAVEEQKADEAEAIRMFKLSAEQEFSPAVYELARCYETGAGVMKNIELAKQYFSVASNDGYAKAQYKHGMNLVHSRGIHVDNDSRAAERERGAVLIEDAAEQGLADAQFWLAHKYGNSTSPQYGSRVDGVRFMQRAAAQHHEHAILELARWYLGGHLDLVAANEEVGLELLYSLAENFRGRYALWARKEALFYLGHHYLNGSSQPDSDMAIDHFQSAAKEGHREAAFELGKLLSTTAPAESVRWYQLAAEQDHQGAMRELAICLKEGRGIERDIGRAIRLHHEILAVHADPASLLELSEIYLQGIGVDRNVTQAREYLERAANQLQSVAAHSRLTELQDSLRTASDGGLKP